MPVFWRKTDERGGKELGDTMCPGAPTQLGGEKILEKFFTPPGVSSGTLEGDSVHAPPPRPRRPPPPGPTPKKGSPLPRAFFAKKGEKRGPNMPKMGFLGGFWGIFGGFLTDF
jgi:hypothetical protein